MAYNRPTRPFHAVRATSAKFAVRVGNTKRNTRNKEWVCIRTIIRIIFTCVFFYIPQNSFRILSRCRRERIKKHFLVYHETIRMMEQTQTAQICVWSLDVFAKLRKATISLVMPIRLSVYLSVRPFA